MSGLHKERPLHQPHPSRGEADAAPPIPAPASMAVASPPPRSVLEAADAHHAVAVPKHYGLCKHPGGCLMMSAFGMRGGSATTCALHKEPGMVDLISRRCDHPGGECYAFPRFGRPGVRPATHQEPGMVDKLYQFPAGCSNYPSYGHQGGSASMCARHEADGMERKTPQRCDAPGGCKSYPVYALPGGLMTSCHVHRQPGSVDMRVRRCDAPGGCDKIPGYGFPGVPAVRCAVHMEPGMVESKKLRCRAAAAAAAAAVQRVAEPSPASTTSSDEDSGDSESDDDGRSREASDDDDGGAPAAQPRSLKKRKADAAVVAVVGTAVGTAPGSTAVLSSYGRLQLEWVDPDLAANLKHSTRNAVGEAWLKGQKQGLLRLLEKDGGASINVSRLRSVSSGGSIVWRNAALTAAGSEEQLDRSAADKLSAPLRKRHKKEADPEAGPLGSTPVAELPRASPDALPVPISRVTHSHSLELRVALLEESLLGARRPTDTPLDAAGITGVAVAAVSRDPHHLSGPALPAQQSTPAAAVIAPPTAAAAASRPQLCARSSGAVAARCALAVKREQGQPPLVSGAAAVVAAAVAPLRPFSVPLKSAIDNGPPLAKKPRHLNSLDADPSAASRMAEAEGGPRGGAAASSPPMQLPVSAPPQSFEGDDVALEMLLRNAAVMTAGGAADEAAMLHAVTGWFDRWDGRMDELYAAKAINVYDSRWRRNLQKAVAGLQGGACLQLLRMVELLPSE